MPGFEEIMKDPRMAQMIQMMSGQRPQGGMAQRARKPANPLSNLADAYPKLKQQAEQMKIEEAERKAKKLKFDMMFKKAEELYNIREQQKQVQQGQQKIQAGRDSI